MKVRCQRIISPTSRIEVSEHPAIRIGAEYAVLTMAISVVRDTSIRIVTESGTPSVWDFRMFSVVDGRLASNWRIQIDGDGEMSLGPSAWKRERFWEDYFNNAPDAVSCFERELSTILALDEVG